MMTMNLQKTLLFFFIPGLVIFFMFSLMYQVFLAQGIPVCWTTYICLWFPLIIMLMFIVYKFTKSKQKASTFFWINKLSFKQILIVLGGLLVVQILETSLGFTRPLLASLPGFHVPAYYPDLFRVDTEFTIPMKTFLGMSLSKKIFPLVFFGIWLITNIVCEEVLWRGYALPRMEKHFGKWAWLVNGILWNLVIHLIFRWSWITLIPISLIVPYLSQKYKSLLPGVIIHGGGNILIFALLIPSYFA